MKRPIVILLVLAAFAAGAVSVYLGSHLSGGPASDTPSERKALYWHDPMVPGSRFDKPGKSPYMDMELVPVYADEGTPAGGAAVVTVRPEIVNSLGVRSYRVERSRLARRAVTHGYLLRDNGSHSVQVDIFDRDADWVRAGMPARITLDALPGETLRGTVSRVDPDIGIGARSLKARVQIAAPDSRLKPNMFAQVIIESPAAGTQLAIPREALIRTGERTAVVLALGDGRFQPVNVVAGREFGDYIEIRQGLKAGDSVVISGQFLIDSESSLRASFTRLTPTEPRVAESATVPASTHAH